MKTTIKIMVASVLFALSASSFAQTFYYDSNQTQHRREVQRNSLERQRMQDNREIRHARRSAQISRYEAQQLREQAREDRRRQHRAMKRANRHHYGHGYR